MYASENNVESIFQMMTRNRQVECDHCVFLDQSISHSYLHPIGLHHESFYSMDGTSPDHGDISLDKFSPVYSRRSSLFHLFSVQFCFGDLHTLICVLKIPCLFLCLNPKTGSLMPSLLGGGPVCSSYGSPVYYLELKKLLWLPIILSPFVPAWLDD